MFNTLLIQKMYQCYNKFTAYAYLRGKRNATIVREHDILYHCQAQATTAGFGCEFGFKYFFFISIGNAYTIIFDSEDNIFLSFSKRYFYCWERFIFGSL